ncbi:transposase, partial [Achromobacter sp.]
AYAGLDPRPKESGAYKGMRKLSKQGDAILRSLAYNAATAAARSTTFKPMYQALLAKGWATTQALNIIARKLLRIAFGVWKSRKPFERELFLANQACVKP